MKYHVRVQVATSRPPRAHESLYYCVAADSGIEAELLAAQWAMQHKWCVMVVDILVYEWEE